ncbi:hypothetical protein KDA08_05495 [Candidatus Saccharibacteria bacterium]|nr:hypothetical protein [Candidatus Saccharibacteria bacterium]
MDVQVEELPQEQKTQSPQATARTDNVAHYALADRFGIVNANKEEDGKLAEIWAFAQGQAKSENIPDIVWEVVHLEGVLGSPRLGESRLDRLYRYCKLKRQESAIQNELKGVAGVQINGRVRL